jgi:hypothetical protein
MIGLEALNERAWMASFLDLSHELFLVMRVGEAHPDRYFWTAN